MWVMYVSGLCSESKLSELFPDISKSSQLCVQKYHRVMAEGLAKHSDIQVAVLTSYPVNPYNCSRRYLKRDRECINKVQYYYFPTINVRVIKHINALIQYLFGFTKFVIKRKKQMVMVIDALCIVPSIATLIVSKICGISCVGIVTDLPCFLCKNRILQKMYMWLLKKYTHYVFLTEEMNTVVNHKKRPYVVIEGQADVLMKDVENNLTQKNSTNICMYTGTISREYGLESLTEAFLKAKAKNWELWFVGAGDYVEDYKRLCKKNKCLKYKGVWNNSMVVKEQVKAALLVNPRPTNMEYTKYSFPSKNMEYMASGTPVLTTKLPGMPKEYEEYVYLIQEESIEGIQTALMDIFSKSSVELHEKGRKAKEFILEKKNNVIQAGKILDMIEKCNWRG